MNHLATANKVLEQCLCVVSAQAVWVKVLGQGLHSCSLSGAEILAPCLKIERHLRDFQSQTTLVAVLLHRI